MTHKINLESWLALETFESAQHRSCYSSWVGVPTKIPRRFDQLTLFNRETSKTIVHLFQNNFIETVFESNSLMHGVFDFSILKFRQCTVESADSAVQNERHHLNQTAHLGTC